MEHLILYNQMQVDVVRRVGNRVCEADHDILQQASNPALVCCFIHLGVPDSITNEALNFDLLNCKFLWNINLIFIFAKCERSELEEIKRLVVLSVCHSVCVHDDLSSSPRVIHNRRERWRPPVKTFTFYSSNV